MVTGYEEPCTPVPTPRPAPDTDWTPSAWSGRHCYGRSSEEDEISAEDKAVLGVYNESLSKLSTVGGVSFSPVTSRLKKTLEGSSPVERKERQKQALEGCRIVCKVIAPNVGEELLQSVCQSVPIYQDTPSGDLVALMTAYRDAPSKNVKIQILSIYAYRFSAEKLIELHKPYENVTRWQIKQARKHAKAQGPGVPSEKPLHH